MSSATTVNRKTKHWVRLLGCTAVEDFREVQHAKDEVVEMVVALHNGRKEGTQA